MLKFCPYCGTKIVNQEVAFCMNCGKSLASFMSAEKEYPPTPAPHINSLPKVNSTKSSASTNSDSPMNQNLNVDDSMLKDELQKCRETAEEGYKLASQKYSEIEKNIAEEKVRIEKILSEQDKISRIPNTEIVETQNQELQKIETDLKVIRNNIYQLHKRQKDFSIIVYGRTMAGKSTLMEILTRGNGQSIGKGAQRTTLDVREYYWQGLKITDVPGICAFGGAEDERLAMEAAKSADLILFLITNDAPQADEAACLAQLKSLGKPILGVINVKMAFNMERRNLALKQLQKKLAETDVINAILEQFKAFDKLHNQDWSDIKFVATHLNAAYQAHPCRANDSEVYETSNFVQVENFILDKVRNDGQFIRVKTFIDSVAVPMNGVIAKVFDHSTNILNESNIWLDKRIELQKWRESFLQRSQNKLDRLYDTLAEELESEIYSFADYYYQDEKVGDKWIKHFQELGFENRYKNLLTQLANECNKKRKELSDELTQQIKYSFKNDMKFNIKLESTTPWGQIASMVLPNLLMFIPGVGWGLRIGIMVAGIIASFLFGNKEEKIREAKEKLRADLGKPSFEALDAMHSKVVDEFNNVILEKGVDEFSNLLGDYYHMFARLGNSQTMIAEHLCDEFGKLNGILLGVAIEYKNAGSASDGVGVFRVPGQKFLLMAGSSNLDEQEISSLLGENFIFMKSKNDLQEDIKTILGCDFEVADYALDYDHDDKEAERTFSLVPKEKISEITLQLAQQRACLPIVIKNNFSVVQSQLQPQQSYESPETKPVPRRSSKNNDSTKQKSKPFAKFFAAIDKMIEKPHKSNEGIKAELKKLVKRIEQQRNGQAMRIAGDYYKKIHCDREAAECYQKADSYNN